MKKSGFTLIELLIVIAIIAILALIAVPNFLEAQTRAKFSRSLADMRAICTAIDQLRMDTGYLPIDGWDDDPNVPEGRRILREVFKGVGDFPEAIRSTTHYLAVLTSPIGYLTQVPVDPFLPANFQAQTGAMGFGSPYDTYIYCDVDPAILTAHNEWNQGIQALNSSSRGGFAERYGIQPLDVGEYALIGIGPDGKAGIGSGTGAYNERGLPYSPTNGTMSYGDVVMRTGGRVNFEN